MPKSRIFDEAVVPQKDVLGLDVAMHDAGLVGHGERLGDLPCKRRQLCALHLAGGQSA